jgi:hypothetical protein
LLVSRCRGLRLRPPTLFRRHGATQIAFLFDDLIEALTELALATAETDPGFAARLLGAADAAYEARGIVRPGPEAERFDELRGRLRAALGEPGYSEAVAAGASLTLDEAVEQALDSGGGG